MEERSSSGIGVSGLLGVVFVTLKLTGYIDWSWWYVTMPFWLGAAIVLGIIFAIGGGALIAYIIAYIVSAFTKPRRRDYVNYPARFRRT